MCASAVMLQKPLDHKKSARIDRFWQKYIDHRWGFCRKLLIPGANFAESHGRAQNGHVPPGPTKTMTLTGACLGEF